jgi:hypothetical protein
LPAGRRLGWPLCDASEREKGAGRWGRGGGLQAESQRRQMDVARIGGEEGGCGRVWDYETSKTGLNDVRLQTSRTDEQSLSTVEQHDKTGHGYARRDDCKISLVSAVLQIADWGNRAHYSRRQGACYSVLAGNLELVLKLRPKPYSKSPDGRGGQGWAINQFCGRLRASRVRNAGPSARPLQPAQLSKFPVPAGRPAAVIVAQLDVAAG